MDYDPELADEVREFLVAEAGVSERQMFGGIAFMVNGNMAVGVMGADLMVRVGGAAFDEAMERPGARIFDFTGRPMKNWVLVGPEGFTEPGDFADWIQRGVDFAASLPPK